jgi:transposase
VIRVVRQRYRCAACGRTFLEPLPEILAYFEHPITNAYTESLNNLIRLTNRIGRGYAFAAIRAELLYAAHRRAGPSPTLLRLSLRRRGEHIPQR